MRSWAVVLLVAATACGGGDGTPDAGSTPAPSVSGTTTTPSPSPTVRPLTKAEARKVVRAGVLKPADVPGLRDDDGVDDDAGGHCLRYPHSVAEADALYATRDGSASALSSAAVLASAADVREDVAYIRGATYRSCFRKAFIADFATEDIEIRDYRDSTFTPRVAGADTTFGHSARMTGYYAGKGFPIHVRLGGATVGQTEVLVSVLVVAAESPSQAKLDAWLTSAVKRVRAATPA